MPLRLGSIKVQQTSPMEVGLSLCFFSDPEGNVIELVQVAPISGS